MLLHTIGRFGSPGKTDAFESGGMGNYQIQFARNRHALPITRDYLAEAERKLSQ